MSDRGLEEAQAELYYGEGASSEGEPSEVLRDWSESEKNGSGYPHSRKKPTNGQRRQDNNRGSSSGGSSSRSESEHSSSDRKSTQKKKSSKSSTGGYKSTNRKNENNSDSKEIEKFKNYLRDQKKIAEKRNAKGNGPRVAHAAKAIGVSLSDAYANIAGQRDALKEMKEDLLAKEAEKEEKEKKNLEESRRLREDFLDKMGSLHYWYYDDVPRSKMFVVFFSLIFAMSLFCFGMQTVSTGSHLQSIWEWLMAVLGVIPLPGPVTLCVKIVDFVVVSLSLYDVLILSCSWAITGAFMADFTYCLIFNKRFCLWPRAKHEYHLIKTLTTEERKDDVRADSNGRGDNKHLKCFYAEIQYVYTLGLYQTSNNFVVSMEVLAQLTGPRIMNLLTDDDMVLQKLVAAGGALDTVNINRGLVFNGINVVSNTEQLAYGFYRHFRREATKRFFGRAPLHHI
jgi:hypothetical protein